MHMLNAMSRSLGRTKTNWFFCLSAFLLCFAGSTPDAKAQVIVVQSTADGLNAGATLENNTAITIPAGKQAIFVLPSGATRTVSGPFKGKASELTKGVKAAPGLFDAVKRYVQTGGTNQKNVGAVRSAAPIVAFSRGMPFSWHAVPVSASGDYCVEKDRNISIVRTSATGEQSITIIDLKSKQRTELTFANGEKSAPWPEEIELNPGSSYAVLTQGRPIRELRIRMIAPLPSSENTLQVLHSQRCESQFKAFIRQIQASASAR